MVARQFIVATRLRVAHDRTMSRTLAFALLAVSLVGCAFDPGRERRPARFLVGANSRGLGDSAQAAIAKRESAPAGDTVAAGTAHTASGQFTMGYGRVLAGVELETGVLDVRGSQFAGAYGVLGAEHASRSGSIGVEMVSGWRGLRYRGMEDDNTIVVEPRVRAQYRFGSQVSVGGVLGATLGDEGSWMVGLNVGFHSAALGR
jgi:hypothetical protein